jgi:hypothetical protein
MQVFFPGAAELKVLVEVVVLDVQQAGQWVCELVYEYLRSYLVSQIQVFGDIF